MSNFVLSDYNERWRKTRPFAYAMMFIFFVPGLVLSLFPDVPLLPASLVRTLYPYVFPAWQRAIIVSLASLTHSGEKAMVNDLSFPSLHNEQAVVVALISFFLLLLIFGVQTWAGALLSDHRLENLPRAAILLPVSMLLQLYALYMLFVRSGAIIVQQPTHWIVFRVNQFLAPELLVISSCLVAITIHAIGRTSYLALSSAHNGQGS